MLSDLHLADSFFGLETGIDEAILSDEEAGRAYLCGAFLANGAFVTLSQASTSWKSVLFIWTTRKELPPFSNSFTGCQGA